MKKLCIIDCITTYKFINKVLYKYQFGFRKNYSTSLALIDVIDNIYSNINNDKFCGGVYLDLQKAFDTVNHTIRYDTIVGI